MIRINQLKLPVEHTQSNLCQAAAKTLKIKQEEILKIKIVKKSIDARKKAEIHYTYAIDVQVKEEQKVLKKIKNPNVTLAEKKEYELKVTGNQLLSSRPVIAGSGPAGLFCAYCLARGGFKPLLIERGEAVDDRVKTVDEFWETGILNTESNVQFGEGGAGTFSDGKLNTMVKDTFGRIKKVLEIFAEHGADEEILYMNKPHIGTDHLRSIVKNMRNDIIAHGGEVRFNTKMTDVAATDGKLSQITVESFGKKEKIPCELLILAIGHSARDTFEMLYKNNIPMERKQFAVGLRMEHKQEMISNNQYGSFASKLPAADYKVTHQTGNGRAVYSFCMCPGGYVVDASSEKKRLCVNGMSYHDRAGVNANSAIIVSVNEKDFLAIPGAKDTPLAGMEFQRYYEHLAYQTGLGKVPVQLYGDFKANKKTEHLASIQPALKGHYTLANLRECLPDEVSVALIEGITAFDRKISGFANPEAVLSGVEMRTSSPVRIRRNEELESEIKGLYPCGEGAGYAGGITSAAADGIKVFEAIARKYRP